MSRHTIDDSLRFDPSADLPETKNIEDPFVDVVAASRPRKIQIKRESYLATSELAEAVNLAIALGRPLLLQGDPGCGKTRLAHAVAYALGLPLEECYIKSTSRARDLLYTYDNVQRLYDTQMSEPKDAAAYVRLGPLGRAIVRAQYGRRSAVLIDEIDKADLDFPNDLLRELDRLEFEVSETKGAPYRVPADKPGLRPVIFVTHNEEKALPPAFLRRCIFHYLEFPKTQSDLEEILKMHGITNDAVRKKGIEMLARLRAMDLTKKPGLSELIDWVAYVQHAHKEGTVEALDRVDHLGAVVKHVADQQRVRAAAGKTNG